MGYIKRFGVTLGKKDLPVPLSTNRSVSLEADLFFCEGEKIIGKNALAIVKGR